MEISKAILARTTCEQLQKFRENAKLYSGRSDDFEINPLMLDQAAFQDLLQGSESEGDKSTSRVLRSILSAMDGDAPKVPQFRAFVGLLGSFLRNNMIDGWLYVRARDGYDYPRAVESITYVNKARSDSTPHVEIKTKYMGPTNRGGRAMMGDVFKFEAGDVTHKTVGEILAGKGIFHETPELKAAYEKALNYEQQTISHAIYKQFRMTGPVYFYEGYYSRERERSLQGRKVVNVHDQDAAVACVIESVLTPGSTAEGDTLAIPVPILPLTYVFDLGSHEFYWVRSELLATYVYDKSLRDKLILPESHRDLLEAMTEDIDSFTGDIIEGKSVGRLILSKGIPGVGKTLTAEVFSELIERPLYKVHTGSLGTSAKDIERNLQEIFKRLRKWGCVGLLDEADVFIMQRGVDIERNAIVAEFLRTLEYFDGLLFMTTNRPDDIDEAIISRCAAIIEFGSPDAIGTAAVWRVQAGVNGVVLVEPLISDLIRLFPEIAPRDIKMLLPLAIRMAKKKDLPLDLDMFRRVAMFRAVHMVQHLD